MQFIERELCLKNTLRTHEQVKSKLNEDSPTPAQRCLFIHLGWGPEAALHEVPGGTEAGSPRAASERHQ